LTAALLQALERCWEAFLTDDLMVTRNCITAACSYWPSLISLLWGHAAVVPSVRNIYDFIHKC
jgi:hypothetical protein